MKVQQFTRFIYLYEPIGNPWPATTTAPSGTNAQCLAHDWDDANRRCRKCGLSRLQYTLVNSQ